MSRDYGLRGTVLFTGAIIGAVAGTLASLGGYVKREIRRRGYPSWEQCRCDFKLQDSFFQVLQSRYEQRGETIVVQEWGLFLAHPPQWLGRLLHHSAQTLATLNPRGGYVERMALNPQITHQLAALLRGTTSNADMPSDNALMVWRHEILHHPHALFDTCTRRLYPAHLSQERAAEAQALPALWDPQRDLPLPTEGTLLETPPGTRIDCIGWTPAQIAYCTARIAAFSPFSLYRQAV